MGIGHMVQKTAEVMFNLAWTHLIITTSNVSQMSQAHLDSISNGQNKSFIISFVTRHFCFSSLLNTCADRADRTVR